MKRPVSGPENEGSGKRTLERRRLCWEGLCNPRPGKASRAQPLIAWREWGGGKEERREGGRERGGIQKGKGGGDREVREREEERTEPEGEER